MSQSASLASCQIVILRPPDRAAALCDLIRAHGGDPVTLPVLEIVPLTIEHQQILTWQQQLAACDFLIVTSVNAVMCAPPTFLAALQAGKDIAVVSMGSATTAALIAKEIPVFFTAPAGSTSETLLTHSFLQESIFNKKVGLLVGEEGRQVLAQTLIQRGATLYAFKVYRSQCATLAIAPLFAQWQRSHKRIYWVATSERTLDCLWALSSSPDHIWLQQCPLIVMSERIVHRALEYGFKHISVAGSLEPQAILRTLLAMEEICDTRG